MRFFRSLANQASHSWSNNTLCLSKKLRFPLGVKGYLLIQRKKINLKNQEKERKKKNMLPKSIWQIPVKFVESMKN